MSGSYRFGWKSRSVAAVFLAGVLALAGVAPLAPPASAIPGPGTVWTVTTDGDTATPGVGNCASNNCPTLRDAIAAAQNGDTIVFDDAVTAVTLSAGELLVLTDITIDGDLGAGEPLVTITAAEDSRVFHIGTGQSMEPPDVKPTVTLRGLTITGGNPAADGGGGIHNDGFLTVQDSVITGNTAGYGGGIHNHTGTVDLVRTKVIQNEAGGFYGEDDDDSFSVAGGIYSGPPPYLQGNIAAMTSVEEAIANMFPQVETQQEVPLVVTLSASEVTENSADFFGGGIVNALSTLIVEDKSTITGNEAWFGGGLFNFWAEVSITDSAVTGNAATWDDSPAPGLYGGGGIYNYLGYLEITGSQITENTAADQYLWGGGIASYGHVAAGGLDVGGSGAFSSAGELVPDVVILDSNIAENVAPIGGGIATQDSYVQIERSTVSGNTAVTGGGIANVRGLLMVQATTIASNIADGSSFLPYSTAGSSGLFGAYGTLGEQEIRPLYDPYGEGGGILNYEGMAVILNSTLHGNIASAYGGAITSGLGDTAVAFSTIAGNQAPAGAGIYVTGDSAEVELYASMVIGNEVRNYESEGFSLAGQPDADCAIGDSGAVSSYGSNIDGDNSCGLDQLGDKPGQSLGRVLQTRAGVPVLQDNGGPTETIRLIAGSPAIDAVRDVVDGINMAASEDPFTVDQRGVARPQGVRPDIGAYEYVHPAPPASGLAVDRVMGYDRYGTAVAVSQAAFPGGGVPVVYIATGLEFPDALAGSAAALRAGGPLLLVRTDSIPSVVADELARLQPARIVVQGGSAAVSDAVVDQLRGFTTGAVTRNAGATRYETAALTAGAFTGTGGSVILATGGVFADALAAGSLYGSYLGPVLLTKPGAGLAADTRAQLARLNPSRVFILGGTGAVSAGVEGEVKALGFEVVRLGGADRYETSALVGEWVRARAGYGATALAATGKTFPDGLTAGVLAGKWNAPVLLTNGTCWSPATKSFLDRLNPARVTLLGGLAAQGLGVANLTTCR